ncbi:hypothetical protein D9M68_423550 [compost metagenome]
MACGPASSIIVNQTRAACRLVSAAQVIGIGGELRRVVGCFKRNSRAGTRFVCGLLGSQQNFRTQHSCTLTNLQVFKARTYQSTSHWNYLACQVYATCRIFMSIIFLGDDPGFDNRIKATAGAAGVLHIQNGLQTNATVDTPGCPCAGAGGRWLQIESHGIVAAPAASPA